MTANELRKKYLEFFEKKDHAIIPSASLIPENDPTTLFITAGMHPLVPYFIGEKHSSGKRLVNYQKCIRTIDIDEVGDTTHHTFFEMLGNWSLGDYFKKEAIEWSWEFLTTPEGLNLDKNRIAVSVFAGDSDAPFDQESFDIWKSLGIPEKRIAKLPKANNWWGPAGKTGPCGPDTEMFFWAGDPAKTPESFNDDNDLWVEIWNDVFMEYNKTSEGKYEKLAQKNVDTGMGLERTLAVINGLEDNYQTELFWPIIQKIEEVSGKRYEGNEKAMRIIADHIKAAVFIVADGVEPSNTQQGYVLRRLIRRAIRYGRLIGIKDDSFISEITKVIQGMYGEIYEEVTNNRILSILKEEGNKFLNLLLNVDDLKNKALWMISRIKEGKKDEKDEKRLKYYSKIAKIDLTDDWKNLKEMNDSKKKSFAYEKVSPAVAFALETTHGYPHEMFFEDLKIKFSSARNKYAYLFQKHQELSRTASTGMFKGGLADTKEKTTQLHTVAHLMLAGLRKVLGDHVHQKGSSINGERVRFDFSHGEKMTDEEKKAVEDFVNEAIRAKLPVETEEMTPEEAREAGAEGEFAHKYGDRVKVYTIERDPGSSPGLAPYSREICGGPHVKNTGDIKGIFKIKKEESSSAGVRRIKAIVE